MSKLSKNKSFRLSSKTLFRLILFVVIVTFAITYFASNTNKKDSQNILGIQSDSPSDMLILKLFVDNIYKQLPPESRIFIENLNNSPIISFTQDKINFIKTETSAFPQKQINDFKAYLINKGHDALNKAAPKNK